MMNIGRNVKCHGLNRGNWPEACGYATSGEVFDPMPSLYWIDITRTCNLQCIMCPQSRGLSRRAAKMSMELLRRLIDDVFENRPLIKLYLSDDAAHERHGPDPR